MLLHGWGVGLNMGRLGGKSAVSSSLRRSNVLHQEGGYSHAHDAQTIFYQNKNIKRVMENTQ